MSQYKNTEGVCSNYKLVLECRCSFEEYELDDPSRKCEDLISDAEGYVETEIDTKMQFDLCRFSMDRKSKKSKESDMSQYKNNEGICSNCKFVSECQYSLNGVQFCEEYKLDNPSGNFEVPIGISDGSADPKIDIKFANQFPEKVLGLCSNCRHRETCGFTKPESGVWHCEEYE
ncbi:MAG TPA: hypothetical protein PKZ42_08460 [Syntrophales bacterium]|nr:hypothetical protein [Syntrophales bacterium]